MEYSFDEFINFLEENINYQKPTRYRLTENFTKCTTYILHNILAVEDGGMITINDMEYSYIRYLLSQQLIKPIKITENGARLKFNCGYIDIEIDG